MDMAGKMGGHRGEPPGGPRSRWGLAVAAGVAGLLGLGSVAWACTQIMGNIKICSPSTATCTDTATGAKGSGAAGSVIKVKAVGLRVKPAAYGLYFADAASLQDCHSAITILKTPAGVPLDGLDPDGSGPGKRHGMLTNRYGETDRDLSTAAIEAYKAVIPATAVPGDAVICGREVVPRAEDTATAHAAFTVVGGS